jgi:hypothetical protein
MITLYWIFDPQGKLRISENCNTRAHCFAAVFRKKALFPALLRAVEDIPDFRNNSGKPPALARLSP